MSPGHLILNLFHLPDKPWKLTKNDAKFVKIKE